MEINILKDFINKTRLLRSYFSRTAEMPWTPLIAGSELSVQLGHLAICISQKTCPLNKNDIEETNSNINDLGDELSDIILQILSIIVLRNEANEFNCVNNPVKLEPVDKIFITMIVNAGQLINELMINEKYRHCLDKNDNKQKIHSICQLMIYKCEQIAKVFDINLIESFEKMNYEAKNFALAFNLQET